MKLKFGVSVTALSLSLVISAHAQGDASAINDKRNPTGALLRSIVIPGWGQVYNGKYIKGAVIAGAEAYLINGIHNNWRDSDRFEKSFKNADDPVIKAREFARYEDFRDRRNLKMWILAATIFYSMFDAYVDAQLFDFNQRDKAYEVLVAPDGNGIQLVLTLDIK